MCKIAHRAATTPYPCWNGNSCNAIWYSSYLVTIGYLFSCVQAEKDEQAAIEAKAAKEEQFQAPDWAGTEVPAKEEVPATTTVSRRGLWGSMCIG